MIGLDGAARSRPGDGESVSSIAKAARILRALASAPGQVLGVTDIAMAVDLAKSTAHRVLSELMAEGLVGRSGQQYRLGPAWFALQPALVNSEWVSLTEHAKYPLADLFERSGATVHLGVLDGDQVLYLEKLTGRGGTALPTRVGAHMPATCTALGKCMLAFADADLVRAILVKPLPAVSRSSIRVPQQLLRQLAETRRTGLAYEAHESQPGSACVAAPIFQGRRVVAAVSLSRVGGRGLAPTDARDVQRTAQSIAEWFPEAGLHHRGHRRAGLVSA